MKTITFLFILILFLACNQKKKQLPLKPIKATEVLHIDSTKDYQNNIIEYISENTTIYDTVTFISTTASEAKILDNTDYIKSRSILFKNKKPYFNKKGESFYSRFTLKSFEYEDSLTCNHSFESWLSNFGTMAVPIQRNVFVRSFHTAPTFVIKTEFQITILFMSCEYISTEWDRLRLDLLSIYKENQKMEIITVGCGGPIEWKDRRTFKFDLNENLVP